MSKKSQTEKFLVLLPNSDNFQEIDSLKSITMIWKEKECSEYLKTAQERGYIKFPSKSKGLFYLPKGMVLYDAVLSFAEKIAIENSFVKMGLPYFFKIVDEPMRLLTEKFQKYLVSTSIDGIYLRYASDPILFDFMRGRKLLKTERIYSPGDFFRNEQSGELDALKRTRALHMTDFHIFTDEGLDEFMRAHAMNVQTMNILCREWFILCDVEKEYFDSHLETLKTMANSTKKPVVFRIMIGKSHYYSIQNQYTYVLSDGSITQIANLQLDLVNGERFNITCKTKYACIVHGTITGRMEKIFLVLFDRNHPFPF